MQRTGPVLTSQKNLTSIHVTTAEEASAILFYSNELLVVRNQSIDGFIYRRSDKTKSHFLSFEYQKHQDAHIRSRFYPICPIERVNFVRLLMVRQYTRIDRELSLLPCIF